MTTAYLQTLHLEREPFSTSPDPAFFYKSPEHISVLNRLEIAIRLKRGLSLILGDVGTGKTTLSRSLIQLFDQEDNEFVFHMILDPSFKTETQFLAHLTKLFGITPFFRSTIDYRDAIEKYLYKKTVDEKKTVVLLIDEAQKLQVEHLEVLRTLLNYETNEQKMLQLIIFGQLELLPRIQPMRNFIDRISVKARLNPLDEYQISQMIEYRLRTAGYDSPEPLFAAEAIKKIYEYTRGYPRAIAKICHNALELVLMQDRANVTAEIIDRVIEQDEVL
ncbi:MAG: AAA family ATPase [Candidatus Omnitrophica bacterium]|nr:AAA family ATPase [Candidatus Omnitrophota bacterium]